MRIPIEATKLLKSTYGNQYHEMCKESFGDGYHVKILKPWLRTNKGPSWWKQDVKGNNIIEAYEHLFSEETQSVSTRSVSRGSMSPSPSATKPCVTIKKTHLSTRTPEPKPTSLVNEKLEKQS